MAGLRELDDAAIAHIEHAFVELGWNRLPGSPESADGLRRRLGVPDRHGRLFARLLEILASAGALARDNGVLTVRLPKAEAAKPKIIKVAAK